MKFKPQFDWEIDEARELYANAEDVIDNDSIIYDDCTRCMKDIPDESVDLVIADPPFGIDFNGKEAFYNRKKKNVVEGYEEINGSYDSFTERWVSQLPRIMKNTASAYIFSGWTNLKDVLVAAEKADLELINHIIWKYQFGVFTRHKYVTSHYHILFLVKDPNKYFFNKIEHYPLDIWEIPRKYMPGMKKNGTKLPEDVVMRAINFSSKPGDLVFDPFMGNGTTAVCAKMTFRHYYGYEINPKTRDIIDSNLDRVSLGQEYKPYHMYLPTEEEIAEKYPGVRKYLEEQED